MSASTNAVASSSRRPSVSSTSAPPNKRPRTEEADDDEDEDEQLNELDDSTRAKMERKQARVSLTRPLTARALADIQTIRNRESAQRSRNQRKAHLANLEVRVAELERENRALRGETTGNTPPPSSRSAEREVSPAQSVISLANDLGLPHDMVTYGVNLATVAPPPRDLDDNVDVKPVVAAPSPARPTASTFVDVPALQSENAALRERIGLLENLVKQVVALSNLGGLPQSAPPAPPAHSSTPHDPVEPFDWNTLVVPPQPSHLSPTLSPTLYPTQSLDRVQQLVVKSETSEMNLACHPAAVVTCAGAPNTSQALQRARTNSSLVTLEMTSARLDMMARVVIAVAKLRGWDKVETSRLTLRPRARSVRARKGACSRTERRRTVRCGMRV